MGELVKQGWRPKRTIVYARWDGEEPALLGSTEWAETHAAELQTEGGALHQHRRQRPRIPRRRRVAHPGAVRQRGGEGHRRSRRRSCPCGSGSRRRVIRNGDKKQRPEARDARRPAHRGARLGLRLHAVPAAPRHPDAQRRLRRRGRRRHLSLDLRHASPGTRTSATRRSSTAARSPRPIGTMVMRMADADLLPYEFAGLAETVQGYVGGAEGAARDHREHASPRPTGSSRTACSRRPTIRSRRCGRRSRSRRRRRSTSRRSTTRARR